MKFPEDIGMIFLILGLSLKIEKHLDFYFKICYKK